MPTLNKPKAVNNWITTKSGGRFDFANPTQAMLNIRDIAGALSKICRFGGHGRHFYSVAEHCINVAHCTYALKGDPLAGLLHDAQEAYVGDMVTPLKGLLPGYQAIEDKIIELIRIKWMVDIHAPAVRHSDGVMLWEEAHILVLGVRKWTKYKERPRLPYGFKPLGKIPMHSQLAERKFLEEFKWASMISKKNNY